jgi:hypothetical protein
MNQLPILLLSVTLVLLSYRELLCDAHASRDHVNRAEPEYNCIHNEMVKRTHSRRAEQIYPIEMTASMYLGNDVSKTFSTQKE